MTGTIDARLAELGISLPEPAKPIANYVPFAVFGHLVQIAGQGPRRPDGTVITGRLGEGLDVETGMAAARRVGVQLLAALRAACDGDLDRVSRCVSLFGLIRCTPEFEAHTAVMNGASDLMVEVFGEAGRHARTTIGARALPSGIAVEIEALFELR